MLNAHFGALANAARAIAMQVQSTALEFSQNFLQALSPRLMRSVATTNNAWTKTKTSTFLMLCISSVVALPIIIWTDEILAFWLKEVPALSADFVRLILISMVFESASEVLQTTALTIGKLRSFQLTTIAGAVVTLVLAYLLVNSEFVPQSIFMVQAAVSLFVFVAKALIVRRIVKAFA
jgi:Na+-driven multidrug efflux pump